MATFRRYGVSAWDIGASVSWGEACDLAEAAMGDSGTELFSAVAGWNHPLSQVDMLLVVAAYGKNAHKVMPFDPAGQATPAEVEAAHDELLAEIKFS